MEHQTHFQMNFRHSQMSAGDYCLKDVKSEIHLSRPRQYRRAIDFGLFSISEFLPP